MYNLTPSIPDRPLLWPDEVLDLQNFLVDQAHPIYIVGGAVRDAYLHRPIKDIDLATPHHSIKLARQIANHFRGDVFVMDRERGVARVWIDTSTGRLTIDVAQFRGADLLADLLDRDFTINAMAVDIRADLSALIDPLNGIQDATRKQLRRASSRTIDDDPIRALRAVRQSLQLGMRIEAETMRDIRTKGPRLVETSAERIRDEFVNLLNIPNPAAGLRVMASLGLLEVILPEAQHIDNDWQKTLRVIEYLSHILLAISPKRTADTAASFQMGMMVMQLDRYRSQLQEHIATLWPNERPHKTLLILAALLHKKEKTIVDNRSEALRLSNTEKQRLLTLVNHSLILPDSEPLAIHRFWHQTGTAGVDICLLSMADYLGTVNILGFDQNEWLARIDRACLTLEAYFERYDELVAPPVLVDGKQLMQTLNLKPCRIIAQLLDHIREEQVIGKVQNQDEALNAAKIYLDNLP